MLHPPTIAQFVFNFRQSFFINKAASLYLTLSSNTANSAHLGFGNIPAKEVNASRRWFSSLPAHTVIGMPSLSPTMSQGNIAKWRKKEGDVVAPGQIFAEVETDKATLEWEAQEEGYVAKVLVPDGAQNILLGTPVLVLVEEESDVAAFKNYTPPESKPASKSAPEAKSASATKPANASKDTPKVVPNFRLGPAARNLLALHSLSIHDVTPTGPKNIVTKYDVLAAVQAGVKPASAGAAPPAASQPAAAASGPTAPAAAKPSAPPPPPPAPAAPASGQAAFEDTPNSQIRRIIAKRLLESKLTIPCLYAQASACLDEIEGLRKTMAANGLKISVNDCVMRAVALALRDVPGANATWDEKAGEIRLIESVDVCVAVATPRGLVTPIVRNADRKSLSQISKEVKDLATRARDNKLKPEEFTGGSFSISNLGMFGISHFSAIVNPPQGGILAIGGSQEVVQLGSDGEPVSRSMMTVTLSGDHRVFDGELTANFLAATCKYIENPTMMML